MRIDSVRGDEKLVGDLSVGAPMRSKICDHGLGFGQCLPPGLRRVDFGGTPSRAETAKPGPKARDIPARPDPRRNDQRLIERGDSRCAVAVVREHPAEVFERRRVGKRARSASIKRNRAIEMLRGVVPDASSVRSRRSARRDLGIEARASFSERDSVFGKLLVSDRRRSLPLAADRAATNLQQQRYLNQQISRLAQRPGIQR